MGAESQPVEKTYDVKAAAAMLGVSVVTLRRMVARGEIAFRRVGSKGGRIRFAMTDLSEYLERRRHPAGER